MTFKQWLKLYKSDTAESDSNVGLKQNNYSQRTPFSKRSMMNQAPQPLEGITVLDMGQIYNGPYCGYLLAMAGARVIKIESPRGETLRGAERNSGENYPFCMLNGNKETITLNLRSEEGQALLKRLALQSDVLLENYAPGTMSKYGVGSDVLTELNPKLIYAAATGFGQSGPHADYRAMDITVQAMSGVVAITGYEDEPPLKSGPALCDMLGGIHLYAAIVTALVQRNRTGKGAILDISMQDSVIPTLCSALGAFYRFGEDPPRVGNHHQAKAVAPYNIYATADGHVAIICIREGHWRKLINAMGRSELADDERFENMATRAKNMELTDEVVESWSKTLSTQEVFEICQENEVICAPVQSVSDVLNDPHLIARGALQKLDHPELGPLMLPSTPLRFLNAEPPRAALPRAIGEDNEAIYGEMLGLSPESVQALRSNEAI